MKKILFSAYSLDIGGIETALVTLINYLIKKEYEITLVLEKKQGIFLNEIDSKVKIIEYSPSYNKNKIIAKAKNAIKRAKFILKYKNKFDCGISYATYSLPGSFIARQASKNNVLWVHSEYLLICKNDEEAYKNCFNRVNADKFKKIVFVSNTSKSNFCRIMKCDKDKLSTINNLIDDKSIMDKSNEYVDDVKKENICTFLFVGRHTEEDKKVSRLLEAANMLKKDNMNFRILIIGQGKNTGEYKEYVKKNGLKNEVIFLGNKKNPYPYYKISDCLVLTSEYEGFPVVYTEAMVLKLPIITTNVSDSEEIINNRFGIVTEKSVGSIYTAMKKFISQPFIISEIFDAELYNKRIQNSLEDIINS